MSVRWTLMAVSAVLAVACVFMICDADGSDADSTPCGDHLSWSMSEGCATFSGYGDMWDYTPSMERGWKACSSVILPDGLTHIGNFAFNSCTSLASVTIPDSVTSIGISAFNHCTSLESVTIGNSVTAIGYYSFGGCTSLASVTIPDSVTSIGDNAFNHCTSLESVIIPDSVTSIGEAAFYSCANLAEVNVACSNPLNISKGETLNGYVAYYASNVNLCHTYSATYGWSDDGKSCTVHIICANTANHNHDEPAAVTSTVKVPPTETEMGTTTYSVSGTYDGFAYSDTKDVQDIPPTGHHDDPSTHRYDRFPALALTLSIFASLGLVGGVVLFSRFRV